MIVRVDPGGRLTFIYSDDLAGLLDLGAAITRRASHVEPVAGGGWSVDLSPIGGPVLGTYAMRELALGVEVEQIEKRLVAGTLAHLEREALEPPADPPPDYFRCLLPRPWLDLEPGP